MLKPPLFGFLLIFLLFFASCSCDCDDNNACTRDKCVAGQCVYLAITPCQGNGVCEQGEENTRDCGNCDDGNACTEDTFDSSLRLCRNTPIVPCCGDGLCSYKENFTACSDCNITSVERDIIIGGDALFVQDVNTTRTITLLPTSTISVLTGKDMQPLLPSKENLLAKRLHDPTADAAFAKNAILLRARFIAKGKANKFITISSFPVTSRFDWEGMIALDNSYIQYVKIEHARSGVSLEGNAIVFDSNIVHHALWSCIYVQNASPTITNNLLEDCGLAAVQVDAESPRITDNNITLSAFALLMQRKENSTIDENRFIKNGRVLYPCADCLGKRTNNIITPLPENEVLGFFVGKDLVYYMDGSGDIFEMETKQNRSAFIQPTSFVNEHLTYLPKEEED
ncbi:MAG: right-handed parallel beta-helix repeat-containing protein [archaeon]